MTRSASLAVTALLVCVLLESPSPAGADNTSVATPDKSDLKFVAGPSAKAEGESVRIEFEVNKATDVAIEIQDTDGRVVRHLVAGLLGPNAPEPLVKEGGPVNPRSIGGDEVAFVSPKWLSVLSDRRLFVADRGNYRILSVKLGYHAEEKVSLETPR